ncbi:endonuclease [Putridiphycobacter roseus]|uniref:Endonuclease n=1 Tax=Putridiphycobacter roseus TaxID=2219161 RepID=A0A2W1MYI0_9FLAO|nr:endonuclease [Putridiphycobacter roseus]PZE16270.1 endonuclease [Putridiphycobacter roseus]
MKIQFAFFITLFSLPLFGQTPSYYNDVNLNLTGLNLKQELAQKIVSTHNNTLSYGQVWNVLKEADSNPINSNNVLLLYGWNDTDTDITNDLNRNIEDNGGNTGDWNREHTYAKSLGTPALGTSGPGADAHNLRASDVQRNGSRGNKKFGEATLGTPSGTVGTFWFPGNEWRGDVARILMYMYLRYGDQCKPSNVTIGNPVSVDLNMVDLLLTWNAIDQPDAFEDHRNEIIQQNQGNRNPFIDNPYLATIIWGGNTAQNRWNLTLKKTALASYILYPNPTKNKHFTISNLSVNYNHQLTLLNMLGEVVFTIKSDYKNNISIDLPELPKGNYLLRVNSNNTIFHKKILLL